MAREIWPVHQSTMELSPFVQPAQPQHCATYGPIQTSSKSQTQTITGRERRNTMNSNKQRLAFVQTPDPGLDSLVGDPCQAWRT